MSRSSSRQVKDYPAYWFEMRVERGGSRQAPGMPPGRGTHHPRVAVERKLIHLATIGRLSAPSGPCFASHGAGVRAPVDYRLSGSDNVVDISVLTSVMSLSIGHLCATRTSSSCCAALKSPVNVNAARKT